MPNKKRMKELSDTFIQKDLQDVKGADAKRNFVNNLRVGTKLFWQGRPVEVIDLPLPTNFKQRTPEQQKLLLELRKQKKPLKTIKAI